MHNLINYINPLCACASSFMLCPYLTICPPPTRRLLVALMLCSLLPSATRSMCTFPSWTPHCLEILSFRAQNQACAFAWTNPHFDIPAIPKVILVLKVPIIPIFTIDVPVVPPLPVFVAGFTYIDSPKQRLQSLPIQVGKCYLVSNEQ